MLKSLFRAITGLIILGAAAQCSAGRMDTVWITGEVGFSCGTGTGGFEKYCSDGENIERGSFSLTYELSGRDSDLSEDRGFFRSAIKSFEMTVSQINRPHLYFSLVGHGDLQRSGNDWVWWQMKLAEENGVVAPSSFMFGLYQLQLSNPNELPTSDFWSRGVVGLLGGGAGVSETDWLYPDSLRAGTVPGPVAIPESGSLWLMLIGLAGAAVQRRSARKRKFS